MKRIQKEILDHIERKGKRAGLSVPERAILWIFVNNQEMFAPKLRKGILKKYGRLLERVAREVGY